MRFLVKIARFTDFEKVGNRLAICPPCPWPKQGIGRCKRRCRLESFWDNAKSPIDAMTNEACPTIWVSGQGGRGKALLSNEFDKKHTAGAKAQRYFVALRHD
jgi:hypothetical protein